MRLTIPDTTILGVSLLLLTPIVDDHRGSHLDLPWNVSGHPDLGQNLQWDLITAAVSGTREVHVKPGTYEVHSPIMMLSDTSLISDAGPRRTTLLKDPAFSGPIIRVDRAHDVVISGFTFDGGAPDGAGSPAYIIIDGVKEPLR